MERQTTTDHIDDMESATLALLPESQRVKRPHLTVRFLAYAPVGITDPSFVRRWFWNSCSCCALTGSVCLASAFVAIKLLTPHASVFEIAFIRSLMGLPILIPVGYFQTGMAVGPKTELGLIVLRGFFSSLAFLLAALATQLLALSEASLLNNCYPALLVLLLWLLRVESMDTISWMGVLGTLFSQALIAQPPFLFKHGDHWDFQKCLGFLCSFLGAMSMSIGLIIVGKIDKGVPSIVIANYAGLLSMFVSLPFLIIGFPKPIDWHPSLSDLCLYGVTACGQLNQFFFIRSFQIGPPIKATMISLTRVVMMMAAGAIVFSEKIGLLHAIGAALMLASITSVIWNRHRIENKNYSQLVDDNDSDA